MRRLVFLTTIRLVENWTQNHRDTLTLLGHLKWSKFCVQIWNTFKLVRKWSQNFSRDIASTLGPVWKNQPFIKNKNRPQTGRKLDEICSQNGRKKVENLSKTGPKTHVFYSPELLQLHDDCKTTHAFIW